MLFATLFSAAFAAPGPVDLYFDKVWSEGDTSDLSAVVTDDFRGVTMAAGQQEAVGHWLTLQGGRIATDQVYFDLGTVVAALKGE